MSDLTLPQFATEFRLKDRLARPHEGPQFGNGGRVGDLAHGVERRHDLPFGFQSDNAVPSTNASIWHTRIWTSPDARGS